MLWSITFLSMGSLIDSSTLSPYAIVTMLSQQNMKDRILQYLKNNPGATAIQLAVAAIGGEEDYNIDIPTLLEQWVDAGKLMEVEYLLPQKNQANSIFFLKEGKLIMLSENNSTKICYNDQECRTFPAHTEIKIIQALS